MTDVEIFAAIESDDTINDSNRNDRKYVKYKRISVDEPFEVWINDKLVYSSELATQ